MFKLHVGMLSAAIVLAMLALAHGQSPDAGPSPYFDCPFVNYFDRDCPQLLKLWEEQERRRLQGPVNPSATPRVREPDLQNEQEEQQGDERHERDADDTDSLFPRECLAPDAPELFRLLLAEPPLGNARRYVRWYARRTARLQEVQALIRRAGRELETGERQ